MTSAHSEIRLTEYVLQELVLSSSERWGKSNAIIVPFTSTVIDHTFTDREQELLSKYFVPTGHKFTITQSMLNDDCVTKNSYRSRMHELLYIEEMACYDQVQLNAIILIYFCCSDYATKKTYFAGCKIQCASQRADSKLVYFIFQYVWCQHCKILNRWRVVRNDNFDRRRE